MLTLVLQTKNMTHGHQILGLIVTAMIIVEFVAGWIYWPRHRRNEKIGSESHQRLHMFVIGWGFLIVLLGSINGFL